MVTFGQADGKLGHCAKAADRAEWGHPYPERGRPKAERLAIGDLGRSVGLEDELIRAAGPALVTKVLAAHGDLRAFRTIQRQPAWRGRDEAAQLRRFLGAGAQRKLRYARLLTEAISLDWMPQPLTGLFTAI